MPKKFACSLDQYANIFRHCELNYRQFRKLIQKKNKNTLNLSLVSFRCKICKNHRDTSSHIRCNGCQDLYHIKCIDEKYKKFCKNCYSEMQNSLIKLQFVTQVDGETLIVKEISQNNTICCICYEKCENNNYKHCLRCNYNQHIQCYNSNTEFCGICEKYIKDNLPFSFDAISLYIQEWQSDYTCKDDVILFEGTKKTNKIRLCVPSYSEFKEQQLIEMYSLMRALVGKSIYFSDDLSYFPQDSKPSDNNSSIELKLEAMDDENLEVFLEFKKKSREGFLPRIMIDFHQKSGFIAKATGKIIKGSIIAEYSGEVKQWKNIIFDKNDSIMELLSHPNPKYSLYVVPEKYSNIARFVCGIDNSVNEQLQMVNVKCFRVAINKQARIIMYACKDILPNQILYYDYNSGGKNQYPTQGFEIL